MKIAFIVTHFPRLSETFVLNQITGLIDRGHEVDIFAFDRSNDPKVHEDVEKYRLLERTFYYGEGKTNIPDNKLVRAAKGLYILFTHFHRNPKAVLNSVNCFKYKADALSFRLLFEIAPFLNGKDDYDMIHCHFGPNGRLGVRLKQIGVFEGKVIAVFHGYDMTKYIRECGVGVYDELFREADLILPICENWKKRLISFGCNESKIMVHRMGVDTSRYKYIERQPSGNHKTRILSIARLVEKKGIRYGVEAVGRIVKEYPGVEYLIIGDGDLRDEVESVIDKLNLKEKVKLLGWKSQEEIIHQLMNADVLLVPSVTSKDGDQEGLPVVLMEAMALGITVVSTCHSGIPELVQDGVTGFLAPERNIEVLAEKLRRCLDHRELLPGINREARGVIEKHYDINKLNDQLVSTYRKLMGCNEGA
jgi:colanic acid/amylovoran/stewartan biosynthesis glycosyltransferase WcaL/AmsK/CpsK